MLHWICVSFNLLVLEGVALPLCVGKGRGGEGRGGEGRERGKGFSFLLIT